MITYLEGRHFPEIDGKIVIVVAKFNKTITDRLLEGALDVLKKAGVSDSNIIVVRVPGAFEIPMTANRTAQLSDTLAVICLGAVIKGETTHDQHINRALSCELMSIGCKTGVPVIFGVLTCNTVEQALARSAQTDESDRDKSVQPHTGNKGADAAEAALEMIHLLAQIPDPGPDLSDMANMFMHTLLAGKEHQEEDIFDSNFDYDDDDDDDDEEEDEEEFGCGARGCSCHLHSELPPKPRKTKKAVKKSTKKAVKKAAKKSAKKSVKKKR
ncbi:MAG: 6,7-dimethyl-8-ribityllumazine synthase [Planctomycetaceae bacterium]|jgi:6,7-dimethyl-8-ribityllumazine synthase|nr:6,7-dimethyl-8-ribityllumazine synthase [Planctomycetaceae bacterium]